MGSIIRLFKETAFEMLTALETIINVCLKYKDEIVKERPLWTEQYFNDFLTTIQNAFKLYLGIDNAKELRAATKVLYGIITPAKDDISKFNTQVKEDFDDDKSTRDEYLNTLGFKNYFTGASNGNQGDLILLVTQFAKNITTPIETNLTTEGMSPDLITRIKGYAATLSAANVTQETAKKIKPTISDASITELNKIYKEGIKICKINRGLYKGDKAKQDLFSYAKTVAAMTNGAESTVTAAAKTTEQTAVPAK